MKAFIPFMMLILLLTGCSPKQPPQVLGNVTETTTTTSVEVIAEGLEVPWSIEKVGDTFYISERVGSIVKVENGQVLRQSVQLGKPLSDAAEAGLLGFVLAPDFLESNQAFAYYTYDDHFGQFNRIVILKLDNNTWREEKGTSRPDSERTCTPWRKVKNWSGWEVICHYRRCLASSHKSGY